MLVVLNSFRYDTRNSLPLHIPSSSSMFGFHCQRKTFLYNLAFDPFHPATPAPQIR